ncbi:MAG: signal peptide peptidase SppA [Myxococcota bacterium]|nr:signal peptide peptidase SppA [Myxococcota bacterium]
MEGAGRWAQGGWGTIRGIRARRAVRSRSGCWLDVLVDGPFSEFGSTGARGNALGFLDLLRTLEAGSLDPRFEGLVLRVTGRLGSFGQAEALGRMVAQWRASGRRVVVWARGLSIEQYAMVAEADALWMPESAELQLIGLSIERFFVKGLLDQLGIRPEVVHVGRYKSAGEGFTRQGMSETEREQLDAWQGDVFDGLVRVIASGRGLSEAGVRDRIDKGPYPARLALELGLIDGIAYADELDDRLEAESLKRPADHRHARRVHRIDAALYFKAWVSRGHAARVFGAPARIVQWVASGQIASGGAGRGISEIGVGQLLKTVRTDPSVRGLLLRIDSPGGDALASDLIHREIEKTRLEKPIVVSMGDVVASGGYYMAAGADAIFAEASTLTGSIGVVGGKMNLGELYDKLGVARDGVSRGARAGLFSEARGYSADERAAVRREMEMIYDIFLDRVARGRNLDRASVETMAQGRVWSGHRALELGLVDHLGGPLEALQDLAHRAGLAKDEHYPIVTLPRPSFLPGWMVPLLSGWGAGPAAS